MKPIAYMRCDFKEKFGIPRQSGIAEAALGKIEFLKEYSVPDAFRGITEYSHLWLIWDFSLANRESWSPTVRPPRLGGNERMGVFATRSPFRPNPLGLSCVEIESIEVDSAEGPLIHVKGADLMDATPIYDIKPYIKYADARPHAVCGYVDELKERELSVYLPKELSDKVEDKYILESLIQVLSLDPRPSYHDDPDREYGLSFGGLNVRFKVFLRKLTVTGID